MTSAIDTYSHAGQPPRVQSGFLAPGTRLGDYELIRGLAIGGMADIYLARPSGERTRGRVPARVVALKRILPHIAAQHEFAAMFCDEVQIVTTLDHTNIARVFEVGNSPLGLFFTMEFVDGCDARQLLHRAYHAGQPIPLACALAIAMGVAAGLHAAHEQRGPDGRRLGVIHRDVSPANVLVSRDGAVKLIDFGIAKARVRQVETRDGTVKGKLGYLSPEQCLGLPIDRRSDVFALGILLYELTTSERLFAAPSEFTIMETIAYRDAPAPSGRRPDYPRALEQVVMRALARDPDERWPTAQAVLVELQRFAEGHGLELSPRELGALVQAAIP